MKQTGWNVGKWLLGIGLLAGLVWLNWEGISQIVNPKAQLDRARLDLRHTEAEVIDRRAQLARAQADCERVEKLRSTADAVSAADYDAAFANQENAKSALAASEAARDKAKSAVNAAEINVAARENGFGWGWLCLAFVVYVVSLLITFYRWFLLVRAQELPFGQIDAMRLGLVGFFFNNFMPGSISGDVIKAVFVAREQQKRTVAIATIIVDRVIGLLGLVFLSALVGIFYWQDAWGNDVLRWILIFVWSVSAAGIAGWSAVAVLPLPLAELANGLRRIPVLGRILAELVCCVVMYRDHSRAVLLAMLMAMIGHVGFVGSFYLCSLSFGKEVPSLDAQFLLVPIGFVVQAVPLTPGGNLGVGEYIFQKLFEFKVGPDKAIIGFLACAAQRLVAWAVALVGLLCYLPLRSSIKRDKASECEDRSTVPLSHSRNQPAESKHEAVPQ